MCSDFIIKAILSELHTSKLDSLVGQGLPEPILAAKNIPPPPSPDQFWLPKAVVPTKNPRTNELDSCKCAEIQEPSDLVYKLQLQ